MANWGSTSSATASSAHIGLRCRGACFYIFQAFSHLVKGRLPLGRRRSARIIQYCRRRIGEIGLPTFNGLGERKLSAAGADLVQFDADSIRQIVRARQGVEPDVWVVDPERYEKNGRVLRDSESPRMLAYSRHDGTLYATDGCNSCAKEVRENWRGSFQRNWNYLRKRTMYRSNSCTTCYPCYRPLPLGEVYS